MKIPQAFHHLFTVTMVTGLNYSAFAVGCWTACLRWTEITYLSLCRAVKAMTSLPECHGWERLFVSMFELKSNNISIWLKSTRQLSKPSWIANNEHIRTLVSMINIVKRCLIYPPERESNKYTRVNLEWKYQVAFCLNRLETTANATGVLTSRDPIAPVGSVSVCRSGTEFT